MLREEDQANLSLGELINTLFLSTAMAAQLETSVSRLERP